MLKGCSSLKFTSNKVKRAVDKTFKRANNVGMGKQTQTGVLEVISELGGTSKAAEFFEVTPSAVSQWKTKNALPKGQVKYLKAARKDLSLLLCAPSKK